MGTLKSIISNFFLLGRKSRKCGRRNDTTYSLFLSLCVWFNTWMEQINQCTHTLTCAVNITWSWLVRSKVKASPLWRYNSVLWMEAICHTNTHTFVSSIKIPLCLHTFIFPKFLSQDGPVIYAFKCTGVHIQTYVYITVCLFVNWLFDMQIWLCIL